MKDQIILTPYFIDQPLTGLEQYSQHEWWRNDVSLPDGIAKNRMIELYRPLTEKVLKALKSGYRPVSLAGDCCTSIAVLAGLERAGIRPTLIWFDAHGDFNTWETTPSGFLGGMPLAMIVGRGEQTIVDGLGLHNLPEENVYLCDGRDLDPGEREALASSSIHHLIRIADMASFQLPEDPLYVHFDTDFIDALDAPAMNYPSPGGPPLKSIKSLFSDLARTGRIAAVSVSSWNPELDEDGRTAAVVWDLLADLLGQ